MACAPKSEKLETGGGLSKTHPTVTDPRKVAGGHRSQGDIVIFMACLAQKRTCIGPGPH